MSLADLLNQATPGPWETLPESDDSYAIGQYNERWPKPLQDGSGAFGADDAALIALAPDVARLLIDMADAVALARGYIPSSEQFGALDINALLARFAALDAKAGEQT